MVTKARKMTKNAKNKKDKSMFIECFITKGKKTHYIKSTSPNYINAQMKRLKEGKIL